MEGPIRDHAAADAITTALDQSGTTDARGDQLSADSRRRLGIGASRRKRQARAFKRQQRDLDRAILASVR